MIFKALLWNRKATISVLTSGTTQIFMLAQIKFNGRFILGTIYEFVRDDIPECDDFYFSYWPRKNEKTQAYIGLKLSDSTLESGRENKSTKKVM